MIKWKWEALENILFPAAININTVIPFKTIGADLMQLNSPFVERSGLLPLDQCERDAGWSSFTSFCLNLDPRNTQN